MKIVRKIIEIDEELCDGCGQCVPSCAEGSLKIIDGKARLVADNLCDGLGACLGECPQGALRIVERTAEAFDEEAVERYLADTADETPSPQPFPTGGCPSSGVQMFAPAPAVADAAEADDGQTPASALSHWPVQIRLVQAKAPFLKNADLLVLADCGAVAFPTLHRDFLAGRVVLMGCPKFDDAEFYVQRFAEIFHEAGIRSITCVRMEVPCCGALPVMVKKALGIAKASIPMTEVVIGVRGQVLERNRDAGALSN